MRKRGYSPGFAAGIIAAGGTLGILLPPSITMILYAVAAEQSLGRLFLAGIGPACCWSLCSPLYAVYRYRKEYAAARAAYTANSGARSAMLDDHVYTLREKVEMLPRVLPFVDPADRRDGGALRRLRHAVRNGGPRCRARAGSDRHRLRDLASETVAADPYQHDKGVDDADAHHRHVAALLVRDELPAHHRRLPRKWSWRCTCPKWMLLAAILFMVIVLGFFLPPVSIILMTAPIILPPLKAAGFDLIWFGVVMTIVMEMGLIHPPVGLNIFVIKNIAPDIPLKDVIWGVMPFVGLMFLAIVLMCIFPGIATGLSDLVMGAPK